MKSELLTIVDIAKCRLADERCSEPNTRHDLSEIQRIAESLSSAMVVRCNWCFSVLEEPGALVFTPPDAAGQCLKIHVCVACYKRVMTPVKVWTDAT